MENVRKRVIEKIEEIHPLIHRFIDHDHHPDQRMSLYGGLAGASLFLYEYARYKPAAKDRCYNKISTIIDNAFDYISTTPHALTNLCDGIYGTLWATEFMRNKGVLELDDDYLSAGTLEHLNKTSLLQSAGGNSDLLHGGFGFWAFLLRCGDFPLKAHYLQMQLQCLSNMAVDSRHGRHWKTDDVHFERHNAPHVSIDPQTSINLGISHGVSGIIILLAKTCLSGYHAEETTENIHKGLQLLQTLKFNQSSSAYQYPSRVVNGQPQKGNLAWCYGDLCVSLAFWMGWKATGDVQYKNEALQIVNTAAALDQCRVQAEDAAVCHGAIGIAQIFRHFYWETASDAFLNSSNQWIMQALKCATFSDGYAGFKAYSRPEYGGSRPEYDLLSGITGIGLGFLSFVYDAPAHWHEALQIC